MNKRPVEIPILFEDNHILVVEKPVNIPSQSDKSSSPDLLSILKDLIKERDQKPGNVYIGLVHRLDRSVGGVMVFAKTSKANSRLSDQIRTHKLDKTYMAIIHGAMKPASGELRHHLLKIEKLNRSKVVKPDHPNGKEAILEYETLASTGGLSLMKIRLKTGRHHQIRVQFAEEGHVLFGDQKYGGHTDPSRWRVALRAFEIRFEHPITHEEMTFQSPPPLTDYPWTIFQGYFTK